MSEVRGLRARAVAILAIAWALAGCGERHHPVPTNASVPAAPSEKLDLEGTWFAELEHDGQSGQLAIRLDHGDDGGLSAFLALPDIDAWWIPIGEARWNGELLTVGATVLRYDPEKERLSGVVPGSLAPLYSIPMELHRVTELQRPEPTDVSAPAEEPAWTFLAGSPIWGGIGVGGGTVFVPDDGGDLHALDPRSGAERWRFHAGGALRARPTYTGDHLLLPSDDGHLYRLDPGTGRVLQTLELGEPRERLGVGQPEFRYDHFASSATVADGRIYIGYGSCLLALDNKNGKELWRFQAGDTVSSTPAIRGDKVFFASFDGGVHAVNAHDGSLAWSHPMGAAVPSSPALYRDQLILGSRSYDLVALSATDGGLLWSYYYWFSWVESTATIRDGVAYIGSSDAQNLYAFDAGTGRRLWSVDTGGSAWAQPAVSERSVFIGTVGVADYIVDHQGGILAVDRASGRPSWRFRVERPEGAALWGFASSPEIDDHHVFFGGLEGRVYAFHL